MTYLSSVMSSPVVSATTEEMIPEIIEKMVGSKIGVVAIVNSDNIPLGVLTERQLLMDIAAYNRLNVQFQAKDIMSSGFIGLLPETPVGRAAEVMIREGVRLFVTRKNRSLAGLVTTTDLLYHFSRAVKDIPIQQNDYVKEVATLNDSKSFLDAVKLMTQKRIGSVVVTRRDLLFGIVTERDILKVFSQGIMKAFEKVRLEDIATRPLISAPFGITTREATEIMEANRIKRLVLLKGEKIAGIITAHDLVATYVASFRFHAPRNHVREPKVLEKYAPSGISSFNR